MAPGPWEEEIQKAEQIYISRQHSCRCDMSVLFSVRGKGRRGSGIPWTAQPSPTMSASQLTSYASLVGNFKRDVVVPGRPMHTYMYWLLYTITACDCSPGRNDGMWI